MLVGVALTTLPVFVSFFSMRPRDRKPQVAQVLWAPST